MPATVARLARTLGLAISTFMHSGRGLRFCRAVGCQERVGAPLHRGFSGVLPPLASRLDTHRHSLPPAAFLTSGCVSFTRALHAGPNPSLKAERQQRGGWRSASAQTLGVRKRALRRLFTCFLPLSALTSTRPRFGTTFSLQFTLSDGSNLWCSKLSDTRPRSGGLCEMT